MHLNSIRARMTLGFVAAIATLTAVACGGLIYYAHRSSEHHATETLAASIKALQSRIGSAESRSGLDKVMEEVPALRDDNIAVSILDARGRVVSHSSGDMPPVHASVVRGWRVQRATAGQFTIVVGLKRKRSEEFLAALARSLILLGICIVAGGGAGAWLLVGRTLSPIGALSRQAQAAEAETLRVQLSSPSNDAEMNDLVATLNGLLSRLGETAAARGRFYAAASHELRTPLQALSGHLELSLSRERSRNEYRETVVEALHQASRLISLVRELLLLNQLEVRGKPPESELIDLEDICDQAVRPIQGMLSDRSLTVDMDVAAAHCCFVPRAHIEILMRNLIENAAKYAIVGSPVSIRADARAGDIEFEVVNATAPISPDAVEKLGEPFFRPDASRNAATGGNGLGLAICRAVASVNGWNMRVAADDGLFTVTMRIPRQAELPQYT